MRSSMKHRVIRLGASLVAAAAIAAASPPPASIAEIGKDAPPFTLTDLDGKSRSLSEFAGKIVVLEWTNPNCPVVRRTYGKGILNGLQKEYTAKGICWLTINSTNPSSSDHEPPAQQKERYIAWNATPSAQLLDPDGSTGHAYGAKTTPHIFIVDHRGKLAYAGAVDDDPRGENAERKHYVRDALDALLAGSTVAVSTSRPYGCNVKY